MALSTDDEGVSRIDITHEYVRAALEYRLSYEDLKHLARTGMEHNFLPGDSLWAAPDAFTRRNVACAADNPAKPTTGKCKEFLEANEKAAAHGA